MDIKRDEKFYCPHCNDELCNLYVVYDEQGHGIALLDVGGMLIRFMSGVCKSCGTSLHWDINTQRLQRLIEMIAPDTDSETQPNRAGSG